jgi:hypothetical protein
VPPRHHRNSRSLGPAPQFARPSLEDIGRLGARYLTGARPLVRRHVETVEMVNETAARRRLTIDLVLPGDPAASLPWQDGARLFYVPAAVLRKAPATSNMDLRDENGRSLPVLNRDENGTITARALRDALAAVVVVPPETAERARELLDALVRETERDRQAAYVASAMGLALALHTGDPADDVRLAEFYDVLRDVAGNSVMWVGLVGFPGERRIIKLGYDITFAQPKLWRRRSGYKMVPLDVVGTSGSLRYEVYDPGDGNERGVLRRLWARIATTVGWAAWDITVDSPYLRNTESYHLEFEAPPGVEVRAIRLKAELVDDAGRRVHPECEDGERDRAHLYFSGRRVKRTGPAEISLRVGRRGYLTYSAISAVVIATMLWALAHVVDHGAAVHRDVSAATLLLVPTLLAVFVTRPDEHTLASRLLGGVRAGLFACGLLSAAAAAALIGLRPGSWTTIGQTWHHYAVAATAIAAVLVVSWVLALDSTERFRRRSWGFSLRYRRYFLGALALNVAGIAALLVAPSSAHIGGWVSCGAFTALLVVAIGSGWLAQFAGTKRTPADRLPYRRAIGGLLAVQSAVLVVAALTLAGYDLGLVAWKEAQPFVRNGAILFFILLVGTEFARSRTFAPASEDPSGDVTFEEFLRHLADGETDVPTAQESRSG